MPWKEHFDETYKAPYWHNEETGESTWTSPINAVNIPAHTKTNDTKKKKKKRDKEIHETIHSLDDPKTEAAANAAMMAAFGGTEDVSPDGNDLDRVSLILDRDRVYADTEPDIRRYSRSLYLNACILECPAAILEATVRGILFASATFVWVLLAIVRWRHQRAVYIDTARACVREAFLCFASVSSLLLPGLSCFVYSRHDTEGEWDLAPLPTILGWVDSRRFAAFALFGGGRFAYDDAYDDMINGPPGSHHDVGGEGDALGLLSADTGAAGASGADLLQQAANTVMDRFTDLHVAASQSRDSWKGPVLCYPRKMQKRFQEILKGEGELVIEVAIQRNLVSESVL